MRNFLVAVDIENGESRQTFAFFKFGKLVGSKTQLAKFGQFFENTKGGNRIVAEREFFQCDKIFKWSEIRNAVRGNAQVRELSHSEQGAQVSDEIVLQYKSAKISKTFERDDCGDAFVHIIGGLQAEPILFGQFDPRILEEVQVDQLAIVFSLLFQPIP